MSILLLSNTADDYCTPLVEQALRDRGADFFTLHTDLFPAELQIDANPDGLSFSDGQRHIHSRELRAVWHRRTVVGGSLPRDMDPAFRGAAITESQRVFTGAIAEIDAFHLDPPALSQAANNKQRQLRVAKQAGLSIPRTCITNDPEVARRFILDCPGGAITKLMTNLTVALDEHSEGLMFTSAVGPDDLEALDALQLCPMTFQERVPKAFELRITAVGDQLFAARINSQVEAAASLDWRRKGSDMIAQWQHHALPDDIQKRIRTVMQRLGLHYGAFDFIVTPTGDYVFLEVNPWGEWFWKQEYPGLPIAQAIAGLLLNPPERP